jgi:hypothetical protein
MSVVFGNLDAIQMANPKLVSMEMDKSQSDAMYGMPETADKETGPKYPFGLQVRLEKEDLAKLGIKELPEIGTDMKLVAECEVISISQNESKDGLQSQCVCLQIEMMGLAPMKNDPSEKKEDPAKTLYGQES